MTTPVMTPTPKYAGNGNARISTGILPHGGRLINRVLEGRELEEALERAATLPQIELHARQLADVENHLRQPTPGRGVCRFRVEPRPPSGQPGGSAREPAHRRLEEQEGRDT